ncbi:hypothetical protein OC834_005879, partial [Tilletia horrida]
MLLPNDIEVVLLDDRLRPMKEWGLENVKSGEWQAYVAAEPGRSFAIQLSVSDRTQTDLTADIFLNGGDAKKVHTIKFPAGVPRVNIVRGLESEAMLHPFTFSKVETTEEIADACEDSAVLSSLGEICIATCPYETQMRPQRSGGGNRGGRWRKEGELAGLVSSGIKIYEKNKKVLMQGVQIGLGTGEHLGSRASRGRHGHHNQPFIYVRREPVYKMRFLARSEFALERAGIIDGDDVIPEEPSASTPGAAGGSSPKGTAQAHAQAQAQAGPSRERDNARFSFSFPSARRRRSSSPPARAAPASPITATAIAAVPSAVAAATAHTSATRLSDDADFVVIKVKKEPVNGAGLGGGKRRRTTFSGPGNSFREPLVIPDHSDDEHGDEGGEGTQPGSGSESPAAGPRRRRHLFGRRSGSSSSSGHDLGTGIRQKISGLRSKAKRSLLKG